MSLGAPDPRMALTIADVATKPISAGQSRPMLERIAMVVYGGEEDCLAQWDSASVLDQEACLQIARNVLSVLATPSPAMLAVGISEIAPDFKATASTQEAFAHETTAKQLLVAWKVMVETVLKGLA